MSANVNKVTPTNVGTIKASLRATTASIGVSAKADGTAAAGTDPAAAAPGAYFSMTSTVSK
jgi:hypothetical protein